MKALAPILALIALLVLAGPVAAQTRAPTNTQPRANPGGLTLNPNGIFGAIVTEAIRQAAQQAADQAGPSGPSTRTTSDKPQSTNSVPATRVKPPVFRDVPLPLARPDAFDGRPILLDAPLDPQSLVVVLRDAPDGKTGEALIGKIEKNLGLVLLDWRRLALGDLVLAHFGLSEGRSVAEALEALGDMAGIVSAQPQYLFRAAGDVAQADMTGLQYAPRKLNALVARREGDGAGVTIGLIDTGIDASQPSLSGADIIALDVLTGQAVADRDHGTALAGLMLARLGFDGIAPGARLISVRAFDTGPDGAVLSGSYEIAAAIDLAVAEGAQVLNLSFAGPRDPLVLSVLDAAAAKGIVFVAAAGNDGPDAPPAYPGAHRDAIAVTATDDRDRLFTGANRGAYVAVSAPGVDVLSPLPDGRFELLTGTSIASAEVCGVVALMLARHPGLDRDAVAAALADSARDLGAPGPDKDFGAGLADAAAALAALD